MLTKEDCFRMYFESRINRRLADREWQKTLVSLKNAELELSFENLDKLLKLRKSKFARDIVIPKDTLETLKESVFKFPHHTGKDIANMIKNLVSYPIPKSTLSTWFKNKGGFRAKQQYTSNDAYEILCLAVRYKAVKERAEQYKKHQATFKYTISVN